MIKNYKLKTSIAFALVCFLIAFTSLKAQVSAYSFSSSAGTYTPIVGGTNNASTPTTIIDDNVYTNQPIGFTFRYDGVDYTAFGMNANGWISLGASAPTSSTTPLSGGTTNNVISAAGTDLLGRLHSTANRTSGSNQITVTAGDYSAYQVGDAVTGTGIPTGATITAIAGNVFTISSNATSNGTGFNFRVYKPATGMRFETLGLAPNRKLVVQWSNFARYSTAGGSVADNISFQIVLTETTNAIDVIYNIPTASTFATYPSFQVGLRGASNADFNNRKTTTDWSATTSGTVNTDNNSLTATVLPVNGQTYSWVPPMPCAGTPAAGTTTGPTAVCPGVNFGLNLIGATTGVTGLTYQWQSSPDGVTYTNIAATTATATVNQTVATYYQCIVTCSNGGAADTSAAYQVPMDVPTNCYCASEAGGTSFEYVAGVVATGGISNTGTNHSTYTNYTATQTSTLYQGQPTTVTVSSGGTWYATDSAFIFIDFNQDGDFSDAGELAGRAGGATSPYNINFNIPIGATLGTTRMRVKFGDTDPGATVPMNNSSCQTGYSFGETEDYSIIITAPPACLPVSGLAASGITTTDATLNWNCVSCTGAFILEYGPTGFTLGTGIIVNPATSPYALTGLTPSTTYQFYVMQDCGGTFSAVVGPVAFTTKKAGDDVCSSIALTIGNNGPFSSVGSTIQVGEPAAPGGFCNSQTAWCNSTLNGSMWFTFVAPASGRVSIAAPGFDNQVAVYSAANCSAILSAGSTLLAANDDGGTGDSGFITGLNCLTPGQTYFVQVDQYSATTGTFNVNIIDLGVANASFTGLPATICVNATSVTLTPTTVGGVFSGAGVTGTTFNPATAGVGSHVIKYKLTACDSTTQTIVVKPTLTGSQTLTVCAGGSVTVGTTTHTTTGVFTDVITGSNGCDSTVTTNLTVSPAITGSQTVTVCAGGSVTVGTNTYSTTGTYNDLYVGGAANGCDSTYVTNLTVSPAITGSQTLTVCAGGSVTVGTTTHSTTGVFTDVLLAANGCDSTVTTNLTVSPAITGSQTVTVCAGGSVTVGTNTYSTTGTYNDLYVAGAANGCDSTYVTNLTVSPAITGSQTVTVCAGGSVTVGTNTYSTTGTYNDLYIGGAANGCDSTYVTNLTVLGALDLSTSVVANVITATSSTATYQWLDCDNGNAIIVGETAQSFTATASGNYAVIVTEAGTCSDTSACVNVIVTGIASNAAQVVSIYPNPSNGVFTLNISNALSNQVVISIMDIQGKIVYSESDKNVSAQYNKQINLTNLAKGIYYVKLSIGSEVQIQKLIIQ